LFQHQHHLFVNLPWFLGGGGGGKGKGKNNKYLNKYWKVF
jgi:hypothetical protein